MTENEAMKNLETLERFYRIAKSGSALHEVLINFVTLEDLVVAIQALEEIQQYRAIGTVEEFKALKEKEERFDRNIRMFNEIGLEIRAKAIDEFAEKLKEKSTFLKSIENDYYGYVSEYEIDDVAEQMKAGGKNE